ncbi:MAG TPA: hypothetical protein VFH27_00495 [Longimicrobiaceae bacterium]|nr:hypothetical protein [Longimicrobiaceae bacterium]
MGLDSVGLILDVEREFGIEIPDAEAAGIETPALLHACILRHLPAAVAAEPADVWDRLVHIFVEEHGIPRERVHPDAEIVRVLGID